MNTYILVMHIVLIKHIKAHKYEEDADSSTKISLIVL